MKHCTIFILLVHFHLTFGDLAATTSEDTEGQRIKLIVNIVRQNLKRNGWNTILCLGDLSDTFYHEVRRIPYAFVVSETDGYTQDVEEITPHYSNTIVISCVDFADYERIMNNLVSSPYWHPYANIFLYYHNEDKAILPKIFFSFWYHKAINAIIVQYDDTHKSLHVSYYSSYVNEHFQMDNNFGCWTARKIGMPVLGFEEGYVCIDNCVNVTVHSKLRANNLGTCIGYNTVVVPYNDINVLKNIDLFEDKGRNLHRYTLRAYATEVKPFVIIDVHQNGSFSLRSRDGIMWNTMSRLLNFTIDLNSSTAVMKNEFNFEVNIKQIFSLAQRKGDLYLIPIYLFDVIIVEVDYTFPYKESGVCIMSHRADFETTLFDTKMLQTHYGFILQFIICFVCIWLFFVIYNSVEKGHLSLDQIGKDFVNAIRNVLLITLYKPPKRQSFRLFLAVSIWGFFIINFAMQATIISFFAVVKRGKEVNTFEDVIEKGYRIEGMASPDIILPDTEERFRKINSKLVPVQDLYGCVTHMSNDSRRFCLIDCSVGRYVERNKLNENGEQYLHIAKDRIHSHYLNIILSKHSPITEHFNKYMMTFFEAGLIKKWEQYRYYADIKDDIPIKPLGMADIVGLFQVYLICVGFTFLVFIMELLTYYVKKIAHMSSKRQLGTKLAFTRKGI